MANTHKRLKGRCTSVNAYYSITICCDFRKPLFANFLCARLIASELIKFSKNNSLNTICYVIMPDHIHWILQLNSSLDLSNLVRNFKNITTYRLNKHSGTHGRIWQSNYYDHKIRKCKGDLASNATKGFIKNQRFIILIPLFDKGSHRFY